MARVRLKAPHYLGSGEKARYYEAGSVIDLPPDMPISTQMEGVDDEGVAAVAGRNPNVNQPSRDLLPSLMRDPMRRQPGQPRAAGPPGQEPMPSADPNQPERTADIVEARHKAAEEQAEADAEHGRERTERRNANLAKAREAAEAKRKERKAKSDAEAKTTAMGKADVAYDAKRKADETKA